MVPFKVDFKTVLVVLARSFCLTPLRFGPGIRSADAIRFINLEIDLWPSREIVMARAITTVILSGAPVNQSIAACKFSGIFIAR